MRSIGSACARMLVVGFGLCVLASGVAHAQSVRWNPPAVLEHGQLATIELVFEGCAPEGDVELPETPALTVIGAPSESRVFSMVNFKSSTTVTLGFPVRVKLAGAIELPSFEVDTSEGPMVVPAVQVDVTSPTIRGNPGARQPLSEVAGAMLDLGDRAPWAGEVVPVVFDVAVDARRHANLAGPVVWDPAPMTLEAWSDPIQMRRHDGRNGVRSQTRGVFPEPGRFVLSPASQDVNVETTQGRGGLFRSRRMRTVTVTSEPGVVTVRPLPPNAPDGFDGAVGQFTLTSNLAPERAEVGEPLTWTLTLRGVGNWTGGIGLPPRAVPNDVEVIQPRSVRRFEEGSLFEGEVGEDLVLIPTRPGTLRLEPVRFSFFDPESGRYETIQVAPPVVDVRPAPGVPRAPGASTPAPSSGRPEADAAPQIVPEPDAGLLPGEHADPRLPRQPVPGPGVEGGLFSAPVASSTWGMGLVSGLLPCVLVVAWLGHRRAARLDALASRRAARTRLQGLLAESASAPPAVSTLLEWQRLAAELLGFDGRAPTEAGLEAMGWGAPSSELTGVDGDAWRRLWREADDAIHRTDAPPPPDWVKRAEGALAATQLRGVPPFAGLRLEHVWPRVAIVLSLWILSIPGPAGAERAGLEAYRSGDFAGAAEALELRVDSEPLDWKARSDLGLARLQLGELDAALAETSAAFVLEPGDERMRWNLSVVSRRAGWIDPALRDLAWGGGVHALARRMSVAAWQATGWAAAAIFWASLAAAVTLRHARRSPRAAFGAAAASAISVAVCVVAIATWGALGERGAALVRVPTVVRSLPTELAEDQIEVALEAGRVVVAQGRFLDWVKVRLANGDLGWVRGASLAPVYEHRSSLAAGAARVGTTAPTSPRSAGAETKADDETGRAATRDSQPIDL